jgi:hypothetical protein
MNYPIANHPQIPLVAGPTITVPPVVPPDLFGTLHGDGTFSVGNALWWTGHTASMIALTYHGYKRNNSVGWAIVWGLFGPLVWPITVPIAVAQGFGKKKS